MGEMGEMGEHGSMGAEEQRIMGIASSKSKIYNPQSSEW